MAKKAKPSTGTSDKPISSPDDLLKTSKKGEIELTEDELREATGGFKVIFIDDPNSPPPPPPPPPTKII